eukprot:TRINITY_DN11881_c0_g1_i7.p2 TRINITY_DN11881_c0_g1~~TRINITY_DN11881_c0_g1_i7.p2  ORF type:complete len:141 (+),score=27.52 TRINITY_DN11881_c0_g1_i7:142-564(+)
MPSLVGSEMCIRDRYQRRVHGSFAFGGSNAVLAFRAVDLQPHECTAMSEAISPQAVEALLPEVAGLIISALNLDMAAGEIEADAPLFGDGLGLDSIDVLEVALVISKQYGCQLKSDNEDNIRIFSSLRALSTYIASQRSK